MASLAALPARCVAPVASRRHGPSVVAPKAIARPFVSAHIASSKPARLGAQIQPTGLSALRSGVKRVPLTVNAAAAGGAAAPAPAKFKWGADMKNLVSRVGSAVCRGNAVVQC